MMESSDEKKKIFYMTVLVLTLITMIIGATMAYFALKASQKDEGTKLYTGTLEINYIDGVYVNGVTLMPMNKPDYNVYEDVYRNNFAISSGGTLDQVITVNLDVSKNEFSEGVLRYIIFSETGKELATGNVPKTGSVTLANNIFLGHNDTAKYTLLIWFNNTGYNQNSEAGNQILGKISIYGKQMKY